jgi:hypothetical protein
MFEVQLPTYRPDSQVKLSTVAAYTGANIYNTGGANQTVSVTSAVRTTRTFLVNVQNDGVVADGYAIKGPGSSTGFTVKYFAGTSGTTDITAAVVAGTYRLTNVAVGAAKAIRMQVTVAGTAVRGATKTSLVTATSTHSATAIDAVKTVVKVG